MSRRQIVTLPRLAGCRSRQSLGHGQLLTAALRASAEVAAVSLADSRGWRLSAESTPTGEACAASATFPLVLKASACPVLQVAAGRPRDAGQFVAGSEYVTCHAYVCRLTADR